MTDLIYDKEQVSDESLVKLLPGFENKNAHVNGINLHYVEGGKGYPLVLLPGWPETWWAYHKMMPLLAKHFHVIVVDIRGMGSSDKPAVGYEKKNMALDIYKLVQKLELDNIYIAGHDIGAHVAYHFAVSFPEIASKAIILDTPPPNEGMYRLPMLPPLQSDTEQAKSHPYPWWLAFNQVKNLPEQLLSGRFHYVLDWIYEYLLVDENAVDDFDRAVYAAAYDSLEGIRGGNGWYQAFPQDIENSKDYKKIDTPVLGIGGSGYEMLQFSLPNITNNLKLAQVKESGHFLMSEKPEATTELIIDFLKESN